MIVLITKILVLLALLTACLLAGLAPLRFVRFATHQDSERRRKQAKRAMSFLSCFGGGVFLATCILDLLPTVRDKLTTVFDQLQIYTSFPVAEFVVAMGFFIIVIVEQTALDFKERSDNSTELSHADDLHGHSHGGARGGHEHEEINSSRRPLLEPTSDDVVDIDPHHDGSIDKLDPHVSIRNNIGNYGSLSNSSQAPRIHRDSVDAFREHDQSQDHTKSIEDSHDMHSHSTLRALILLLALSLHSIFEGLAIGLQGTNDQVLDIFTAVIIHKTILAFSLGMSLVQSKLSKRSVIQACVCFAIMAPIGIATGILVIQGFSDFTHSVFNGILQGLATGTFLYITFFEVLPHEMNAPSDRLLKVLCLILGFSTICGLLFLEPDVVKPA